MSNKDKVDEMNEGIKSRPEYNLGKSFMEDYAEKNHSLDGNPEKFPFDDPEDHEKGKAKKFLNSLRGHLIISQALTYGISHLRALEDRKNKYPKDGEHAEPSNRSDMEYLKKILFPLYDLFDAA